MTLTPSVPVGKALWTSKTLWVNVIGVIALIAQSQFGFVIDPTIQGYILAGVNVVLRLITKQPVTLT